MKAFREVKRLFLGIFCDVKEIPFQSFAPGFAPDFKVSEFLTKENLHVLILFSQEIKMSSFTPIVSCSSRQ